jgi:hypothetical protein
MIDVLRPAAPGAILARSMEAVIGTKSAVAIPAGEALYWTMLVGA